MTSMFLLPPHEKVKIKGHAIMKVDISTRHDPSYFEIIEFFHNNTPLATINSVKLTKKNKLPFHRTHRKLKYIDCFLLEIRQYIHNIVDVEVNGHCGFRSIVGLLGFGLDDWSYVR